MASPEADGQLPKEAIRIFDRYPVSDELNETGFEMMELLPTGSAYS